MLVYPISKVFVCVCMYVCVCCVCKIVATVLLAKEIEQKIFEHHASCILPFFLKTQFI